MPFFFNWFTWTQYHLYIIGVAVDLCMSTGNKNKRLSYTVGTESIQTPLNVSLFVS